MPKKRHKIVLATRNRGKVAEISRLLAGFGVEVLSSADFPKLGEIPETGQTFEENARQKARAVAQATGLTAMADDSGLVVDALDGAPGVHSARYGGENASDEDNWQKLLTELAGVPLERRTAKFVCVIVVSTPDGREISARGEWPGLIALEPQGHSGFGYDPVFFDEQLILHAAQMTPEIKNSRSHRGLALAKLRSLWPDFLASLGETVK